MSRVFLTSYITQVETENTLRKSNSVESVNSKRYLSALESDIPGVGDTGRDAGRDAGRPRPEGAEQSAPVVPPRVDKMDLNNSELIRGFSFR